MRDQIAVLTEQRVDNDLEVICVVQGYIAHDQAVDNTERVVRYEQNRTIFRNVSERAGIPIKRDIGELKGFSEEHPRVDTSGF